MVENNQWADFSHQCVLVYVLELCRVALELLGLDGLNDRFLSVCYLLCHPVLDLNRHVLVQKFAIELGGLKIL